MHHSSIRTKLLTKISAYEVNFIKQRLSCILRSLLTNKQTRINLKLKKSFYEINTV